MLADLLAYLEYTPRTGLVGNRISPHGIGIGVGYLVGGRVLLRKAAERGIDEDHVYGILFRALIGAILGARLFYVLNHLGEYANDPLAALRVWEGGLTLLGGIAGGVLVALPYIFRERLPVWRIMDAAAFGLPIGVFIGRLGDLIVGDHIGKATTFFLGYLCTSAANNASHCDPVRGPVFHQPALYDLVQLVLLMGFLYWLERRTRRRGIERYEGFYIFVFVVWYGVARLIEDVYRSPALDKTVVLGLTGSQFSALVFMLLALYVLVFMRRTPHLPEAWRRSGGKHSGTSPPAEPEPGSSGDDAVQATVGSQREESEAPETPAD